MTNEKSDHILIVEDSPAITILLRDFLQNLGYDKIHTSDTGGNAVSVFSELIKEQQSPIVLLDYQLPDVDARSVMTQLLDAKPDVKVILVTATEKSDEGVTELIRKGLYQYLEKPIRFEKLKEVLETLEKEKQLFSSADSKSDSEKFEHIDFLLHTSRQISLAMLTQLTELSESEVLNYLSKLESENKVIKLNDKKMISCNQCDSVKVTPFFSCPHCSGSDFKTTKFIEHYDCANILMNLHIKIISVLNVKKKSS